MRRALSVEDRGFAADINWTLIYLSLTLVITIICTVVIVYRIIQHSPGISSSRKIIGMLIESSAMYSLSLIVYLALVSRNSESSYYADIIMAYTKVKLSCIPFGRGSEISQDHRPQRSWSDVSQPTLMPALIDKKWLPCWRIILPWSAALGKEPPITVTYTIVRMGVIERCRDRRARRLHDLAPAVLPKETYLGFGIRFHANQDTLLERSHWVRN